MALTDRVKSKPTPAMTGKPCSIGALIERLPDDEVAALNRMLGEGWTQPEIYAALESEGHVVGFQSINRHRSRACRCYRQAAS